MTQETLEGDTREGHQRVRLESDTRENTREHSLEFSSEHSEISQRICRSADLLNLFAFRMYAKHILFSSDSGLCDHFWSARYHEYVSENSPQSADSKSHLGK